MAVERRPGALWLARTWEELRKVNFQWVAASGDGMIAHDPRLEFVIDEVRSRGLTEEAVYALIDFDEPLDDGGTFARPPSGLPRCDPPSIMPTPDFDEETSEEEGEEETSEGDTESETAR